jgi:hypothetical protein
MIVEQLDDTTQRNTSSFAFEGYWHSSSVGGCQREQLLWAMGLPGLPITADQARLMKEGQLHEYGVVTEMRESGITVLDALRDQKEYWAARNGTRLPLVCHPDGRVPMGGADYGLEIKSMQWGVWKQLRDADPSNPIASAFPRHYAQVQIALDSMGVGSGFYIAKHRPDGKLREEIIRIDPDYLEWLYEEHFKPIVVAYALGADPNNLPCHSQESVRNTCDYRHICQSGDSSAYKFYPTTSVPTVNDVAMGEKVTRILELKKLAAPIDEEYEQLRAEVKEFLISEGIKKGVIADTNVQIVAGSRTSFDRKVLEELIPEEELKRATRRTEYESLRIG